MMLKNLLRDHYQDLKGYVSAGMEVDKSSDVLFLNANENPFELTGLDGFSRYPEPQPKALLAAYAENYGVAQDHIVMTRGADEAIVVLTKLFCEPHQDKILISSPAFGMYSVNASGMPSGVVDVPLIKADKDFALDQEGIIEAACDPKAGVKLVYICNPNNPTGTPFSHEVIGEICKALEGHAAIVLDETYAEFSRVGSMSAALADHPNLIILRTLSKSYALAGMRMGCFLCGDKDVVQTARDKALDAYPLPRASVDAALHVLSPDIKAGAHENIQILLDERARMKQALGKFKWVRHVYPSDANFLLVEMDDANAVHRHCQSQGIILRNFSDKPGTENCLRLSIGTPEQNDRLLKALSRF